MGKQPNMVYNNPCSCSQVYIADCMVARIKEYWDTCEKRMMENLAVVEHVWENYHAIN